VAHEELDQFIRKALKLQAYQTTPARPEDAARLLHATQAQQITGRWEGYGRQKLLRGMLLTLPAELGKRIAVPHDMTAKITMRLTMESSSDYHISGEGELDFNLRLLGEEFTNSVYVDIVGDVLEDGRLAFETQNIEDNSNWLHLSGTLSEDGRVLSGTYQAVGLMTQESVTGEFFLEKARELREDYEMITFEIRRRVIDLIRQARRSVLVTHFTTEIPPEDYVSIMLEKLHDEVTITRIVAFLPGAPKEVYSWLNRFRKRDGTTRRYYKEYQFPGTPLHSDIMVIDDEVAMQYFATYPDVNSYSFAICHYDPRVARRFREYFEALIPNQTPPTTGMRKLTRVFYE
jgi:hypothetical protein